MVFKVTTRLIYQPEFNDFHEALDDTDCFSFAVGTPGDGWEIINGNQVRVMFVEADFQDPRIAARFDQVWG